MKIIKHLLVVQVVFLFFNSSLFGQLSIPIGEKELVTNSSHIVIGKVKNLECFWFQLGESRVICTKVFIEPENVLKGKMERNEMVIYTPVGKLDGINMRLLGAPEYEIGERVFVFCELQKEGYFKNYGSGLGKKTIKNDLIIEDNISLQKYISKIKSYGVKN